MTPPSAPIAEYPLAGDATDVSGHGHHGVVHGAVPTADRFGVANGALEFDGVDDYIEVTPAPPFTSATLSVSAWVRLSAQDFGWWSNSVMAQDDGNDDDQSRRVFQLSVFRGHLVWHRMMCERDPICTHRVRVGVWQHVAAVHDAGVSRLYVDGALRDEVRHGLRTHATQPLHIGRKGTSEPQFFFKGAIDDVRIYDCALSDADVRALACEGGWTPPPLPRVDARAISGAWGQQGVVFLDLVCDANGGVTGEIMNGRPDDMVPIVRGTCDLSTGALHLEGTARDRRSGAVVPYVIDGALSDGKITVVGRIADFEGNFIFSKRGAALRASWRSVRSQLGALAFRVRRAFSNGGR